MSYTRSPRNKYGLPANRVVSVRPAWCSQAADVWLRSRDELTGLALDALDAFKASRITRRQYDKEHARLRAAIWRAEQNYELTCRAERRRR